MKTVLILGGTNFIGRVLVEKLLQRNDYAITLFNRGKRNAGLFDNVPQIHGDRETDDYLKIAAQHWDYIIDCSGYYPLSFDKLLHSLKGKVGRYIFVSTISVFDIDGIIGKQVDEDEAILPCSDAQKTSALPDAYGEKKAEMERILLQHEWLDKIIIRPSLVYGKYDFTDRFYYWLWRAKHADKIMLPNGGNDSVGITYVDDLADLIIASISIEKHSTTYNAVTHDITFKELVDTCTNLLGTKPELVAVSSDDILAKDVQPWQDVPLWLNGDLLISNKRALHDYGIQFSRFADSVKGTIAYYDSLGWPACKAGISVEKEQEIITS